MNHLPSVRDLCVEQKMIATVSAGVKPELFLGTKIIFYKHFNEKPFEHTQIKCRTYLHVNLPLTSPRDRLNVTPKSREVSEFLLENHF